MAKSLIIVESPAKTKTLKNFLGPKFLVEASMGHVRDLPKSDLGVDVEDNFKPKYVAISERKDVIKKLQAAAKGAEQVYLASDPDREGEAIAWHLSEVLKLKDPRRIRFNEITASAVNQALSEPTSLDGHLVDAQQARRVLDRLVGYKLSPLLWKKIKRNLSAGRVQSVAVKLICEREREIEAFVPVEYWSIIASLTPREKEHLFEAKLLQRAGKKIELGNQADADEVMAALKGANWIVDSVKKSEKRRNAPLPFITSTLQQEASRKLNFSARWTMSTAQRLYEGIEIGDEGQVGLITYMRTDSTRISDEAQEEAKRYITDNFGPEFVGQKAAKAKGKRVQDAHEAIRPTRITRHPDDIKQYLSSDQYRLYKLIWQRFTASQMAPAVYDVVTVDVKAADMIFRATGSTPKFLGFTKVYTEGKDDAAALDEEEQPPLPVLEKGQNLDLRKLDPKQHFTEPPPRYTEATLVRALETNGIGRPSTYAAIISTIQDRKYVELQAKRFKPTQLGFTVNDQLVKHFPDILDTQFTAGVENKLDKIEEGSLNWVNLLKDFYSAFDKDLQEATQNMENVKIPPKESDQVCPNCGAKMLVRESRFGEFLGCSRYPDCKTIVKIEKKLDVKCPTCSEGDLVEKKTRKGKLFFGCARYPDCDFTTWDKPTKRTCPECGSMMTERRFKGKLTGYKCIKEECGHILSRGKTAPEGEAEAAETETPVEA